MSSGFIGLIIILLVIIGAVVTKRAEVCMFLGTVACCIFLFKIGFVTGWCGALTETMANNMSIFLVICMFGAFISLLQEAKGSYGFNKLVIKLCNSEKKTLLTTFIMGVIIFVDDYLNVLSIGPCMRGIYDKRKIPREALAFMLDATGTPVCVLIPFSNWAVFYAALFIEQPCVQALGFANGFKAYMSAIPFCFYAIFTLIIVILFSLGIMPKLGSMKQAYERVATTGMVYSERSKKYNKYDDQEYVGEGKLIDFLLPMLVMIVVCIAIGDMLPATIIAMAVCAVMYIPRKIMNIEGFITVIIRGIADMLPVTVLTVLAFTLGGLMDKMGLTEYVIGLTEPLLSAPLLPAITFILVSGLCFCTASLWGMCAVVIPIVFPLVAVLGANPILVMAAVISGGAFGSHACFYCDATLLASNSSGIESMEHALSQFPYVVIAAALSIISFVAAGYLYIV